MNIHTYYYEQLDPRNTSESIDQNDVIFGDANGGVMGIEVTIPSLAKRCLLGNIDHHGRDAGGPAAIEQALTCTLPPYWATLATIRPDLDSVGAMAIITLRARAQAFSGYASSTTGWETDFLSKHGLEVAVSDEVRKRALSIAIADTFTQADADEWRPKELPTKNNPWPGTDAGGGRELAALAAAIADFRVSLEDRVEIMERWLIAGEEPEGYREKVEVERQDLIAALENGEISYAEVGGVAKVISTHRAATTIGYSLAPVVVALNPEFKFGGGEPHAKFTICQFKAGYVDLTAVFTELSEREPGWGGTLTIGGSPQGVSSKMAIDDVISVVKRHLID